jgi:D-glycero-D-manno-heptose 1,7-bisphosphate phosphatase
VDWLTKCRTDASWAEANLKRPAIFLDRDGVINENRAGYVKSWSEVEFLPGVFGALRRLAQADFTIVLVTNQSAVGRGIISHEEAIQINRRVVETIQAQGGRVDGAYLCPHHPDENCACRKPRPGLLLQAADELDLDLDRSYLVGDAVTDMLAADAAGVKGILVLTGRGQEQVSRAGLADSSPWLVVADLGAAVDHILNERT